LWVVPSLQGKIAPIRPGYIPVASIRKPYSPSRSLPCARGQPPRPARHGLQAVHADPGRRAHQRERHGRGPGAGGSRRGPAYAKERQAFGKSISKSQAIQAKLADISTEIEAARLLTYKAAKEKDEGKNFSLTAAQAKLKTGRLAVRAAEEAVQIHGGYGYIEEYPVCRFYRDAKILTIGEGTDEVQQMVIARARRLTCGIFCPPKGGCAITRARTAFPRSRSAAGGDADRSHRGCSQRRSGRRRRRHPAPAGRPGRCNGSGRLVSQPTGADGTREPRARARAGIERREADKAELESTLEQREAEKAELRSAAEEREGAPISVDLPTPGGPVKPTIAALPVCA
jgi:hypothetical protein